MGISEPVRIEVVQITVTQINFLIYSPLFNQFYFDPERGEGLEELIRASQKENVSQNHPVCSRPNIKVEPV